MRLRNTENSFGVMTKTFHWSCVVLVISQLFIGYYMGIMDNGPDKLKLYGLHKSIGATILMLASCWFVWRLTTIKPRYPMTMGKLQVVAANLNKYALLTLLFAMPLTGWGMSSAAGYPVSVYGLFTLPNLVEVDRELSKDLRELHDLLAYCFMALIAMHASAALLHHFYYKDNILRRMIPLGGHKE